MKRFINLLLLAIVINSTNLLGQEKKEIRDTININEVVVTGTRVAVSRNYVPLTISIINNKQITESSESALLPVLTEWVPGLFVTERGVTGFGVAQGSAGQITIRGVGGSPNAQVLFLLNGNPQYMGIFGHPLPDAYIASDVERVEVIRGPASTLYGSNAMGGVINIITKKQEKEGFSSNGRVMYGSYNTGKYMVNGGYKKDRFNIFASINHDRTNGHRDSSDFHITNGYMRIGYDINEHFTTNLNYSVARFRASDPGPITGHAGNVIDITRGMGAFVLNNQFNKVNGSFRFFYNYGIHNISDGFRSRDNNYGIVWNEAFNLFKGNTLTLGFDYKNYGGLAKNRLAMHGEGIIFADTSVYEMAGYLFIQQKLFSSLMLNAGFRLEHNEIYGNIPVPTAGIAWNLSPNTIFKGSVSRGFRSPTIRELFMWGPANDSLKPEEIMNNEISYRQYLFDHRFSFDLTLYAQNGKNLIKTILTNHGPENMNTGTFSNKGVEVAINYKPVNNLQFHTNLSWILMDIPIIATPKLQFFISGSYQWKKLGFNLSWQSTNGLYLTTGDNPVKESYNLLSSRISYKLNKYIHLFMKGENLLNTQYQINYEYPMPGICVFGGINLQF